MDGKSLGTLRTRREHHADRHAVVSSNARNFIMPRPWPSTVNVHDICPSVLVNLHEGSRRIRSTLS
jgi:hypothetical protein